MAKTLTESGLSTGSDTLGLRFRLSSENLRLEQWKAACAQTSSQGELSEHREAVVRNLMETAYYIFAGFLVLATLIPLSPYQHWTVRGFDFGKIQLTLLESLTFIFGLCWVPRTPEFWVVQLLLMACQSYNLSILLKYSWLYPVAPRQRSAIHSNDVTLLSANVLQFNTDYPRLSSRFVTAIPTWC